MDSKRRLKRKIGCLSFVFVNLLVLVEFAVGNSVQISSYARISKNGAPLDGQSPNSGPEGPTRQFRSDQPDFVFPQKFNETTTSDDGQQQKGESEQQIKLVDGGTEGKEREQFTEPSTGRAIANRQYPFPLNGNYFPTSMVTTTTREKQAKYYPAYNHRNTYEPVRAAAPMRKAWKGVIDRQGSGYLPPDKTAPLGPVTESSAEVKYTPPKDLYNFPPVDGSWNPSTFDSASKYKNPISSYLPPAAGLNDDSIGTINVPGDDDTTDKPAPPPKDDSGPPDTLPEYLDHPPPGYEDSKAEILDHPPPGYEDTKDTKDTPPPPPPPPKPTMPAPKQTMPPPSDKSPWNGYYGHDAFPEVVYDYDPHQKSKPMKPSPKPTMPPPPPPTEPPEAPPMPPANVYKSAWNGYYGHDASPEVIYDFDPHHDEHHHHHHIIITTTPAPPPPPAPVKKRYKYGYYLIFRKFWYIPLYFTIYFVAYLALLIIKQIFRKKVDLPNHYGRAMRSVHDWTPDETRDQVNRMTEYTLRLIDGYATKVKSQ